MIKTLSLTALSLIASASIASADKLTPEQAGVLNKTEPFVEGQLLEGASTDAFPTSVNSQITDVAPTYQGEPDEGSDCANTEDDGADGNGCASDS